MLFHASDLYPGSRVGDTVRVRVPGNYRVGFDLFPVAQEEHYQLVEFYENSGIFVGELIDYVAIARSRIRKQVYF